MEFACFFCICVASIWVQLLPFRSANTCLRGQPGFFAVSVGVSGHPGHPAEAPANPGLTPGAGKAEMEKRRTGEELKMRMNRRAPEIPGTRGTRRSLQQRRRCESLDCVPEANRRSLFKDETKLLDADAHMCSHRDKALGVGYLIRVLFCCVLMILSSPAFPRCQSPFYLSMLTNNMLGY